MTDTLWALDKGQSQQLCAQLSSKSNQIPSVPVPRCISGRDQYLSLPTCQ